jgi:hypothetical protein
MASRPANGPADPFLQQEDGNPNNKYCSRQSCQYEKHSKKFLHCIEIHFEPVRDQLSYDSFKTLATLSKVPMACGSPDVKQRDRRTALRLF